MRKIITLIGMFALTTVASAQLYVSKQKTPGSLPLWNEEAGTFENGNQLYASCGNESSPEFEYCIGFITGVVDVLQSQNANAMCLPKGANVRQIVDVVKKRLRDYPETRQYAALSEVEVALEAAFPCRS